MRSGKLDKRDFDISIEEQWIAAIPCSWITTIQNNLQWDIHHSIIIHLKYHRNRYMHVYMYLIFIPHWHSFTDWSNIAFPHLLFSEHFFVLSSNVLHLWLVCLYMIVSLQSSLSMQSHGTVELTLEISLHGELKDFLRIRTTLLT